MVKNVQKNVAEGDAIIKANAGLDLSVANVIEMAEASKLPRCDALIDVIVNAYKMGVAVGTRNGKRAKV